MKEQSAAPDSNAGSRRRPARRTHSPDVVSITNASEAHSIDMARRMRKYLITMGIRMVCLAAIFVFDGWYKLIPVVGAVLLPWVAVLVANGGSDINQQERTELLDSAPRYELGEAPQGTDDADSPATVILTGEIVPEDGTDPTAAGMNSDKHP
ncbi:DUF3099 domain-containing protein [Specibacter sp. NPDC057265]|uniref:DUF3099 domain-containing protein n=1 Tax=Specibacter sp. NPDC057265 TaxID=3346075 RepID=UPI0036386388